jgi:hypothetical protein
MSLNPSYADAGTLANENAFAAAEGEPQPGTTHG